MKALKYLGGGIALLAAAAILLVIAPMVFLVCAVLGLAFLGVKAFT